MTPRTEIIGGDLDAPAVLVVVGETWPGDDEIRRLAVQAWNDLAANPWVCRDPLPEPPEPEDWAIGRCDRFRWVPCDPDSGYSRWLFPVRDLAGGSFWGVQVEPTDYARRRADRMFTGRREPRGGSPVTAEAAPTPDWVHAEHQKDELLDRANRRCRMLLEKCSRLQTMRCAKHTGWCLVPARAIGLPGDGHLCSLCMREHYDRDVRESA